MLQYQLQDSVNYTQRTILLTNRDPCMMDSQMDSQTCCLFACLLLSFEHWTRTCVFRAWSDNTGTSVCIAVYLPIMQTFLQAISPMQASTGLCRRSAERSVSVIQKAMCQEEHRAEEEQTIGGIEDPLWCTSAARLNVYDRNTSSVKNLPKTARLCIKPEKAMKECSKSAQ